jgi:cytochrome c peroxidase
MARPAIHRIPETRRRAGLLSFFLGGILVLSILAGCRREEAAFADESKPLFAAIETLYLAHLDSSIAALDRMGLLLDSLRNAGRRPDAAEADLLRDLFLSAKGRFKSAEPVLAYAEKENYKTLNAPNILKVVEEDATNIKVMKPTGFQVLDEIFAGGEIDVDETADHVRRTRNRLGLIRANAGLEDCRDYHFLWLFRDALLRVAFLGLSGFDSPAMENSLPEARLVLASLAEMLETLRTRFRDPDLHREWREAVDSARADLAGGPEAFAAFDRFRYLRGHLHRQIGLWNRTVEDWRVVFPFETALRNRFDSPFSREAYNPVFFSDPNLPPLSTEKQALGRDLFHDPRLSSPDRKMSCASCHLETRGFADNNRTSFGLKRNTPTVAYAGLQRAFFLDSRAGSLEGQIVSVVEGELEFHSDLETMAKAVAADARYLERFAALYRDTVTEANVRNAVSDYVRGLMPFASRFDRAMRGEGATLADAEVRGFNLFMGKGKCATCHFPPVFNGTIPPAYTDTELEHLGVPSQPVVRKASISPDLGRFHFMGVESRKHFFKTPTVRNVEKTFPYMHNGVFDSLEQVVDFYNRGGGIGIGITGPETEFQTLPPEELGLTREEMGDLVAFMKSLTDDSY